MVKKLSGFSSYLLSGQDMKVKICIVEYKFEEYGQMKEYNYMKMLVSSSGICFIKWKYTNKDINKNYKIMKKVSKLKLSL